MQVDLTSSEVARLRLYNQRISGPAWTRAEEVVRWLGAAQAQDYQQALWAIGLRTRQPNVQDVERAIAEGKLVRTWPMRGTLHLVPAEDAKWMLKLSASRMIARDGRRLKALALDESTMEHCARVFAGALAGGKCLSRLEMVALLQNAGIDAAGPRAYHILWYASQTGLICPGPMQGKEQTFVLLDEWVPHSRVLSREESLAELAQRYFTSHGPATVHDFAWWAGLTVSEARQGAELARTHLTSAELDGKACWMAEPDTEPTTLDDLPGVHLLPAFDEYLLGYRDRSAVLAAEHATRVVPGNNGVFLPTIVVGGQVVGTWKRKLKQSSVEVTLNPFAPLGEAEEQVTEAARCYADFLGLPLSATPIAAQA
ncbi:MAG: winged helix DNA-binding domain-containing protein [Chloroflexota bacterium]|nr:winged helix DNA-binding domain-containing protein [Chloroflexota bacterium]